MVSTTYVYIEFEVFLLCECGLYVFSGDLLQKGPQIYPVCNGEIGLPPFLAAKV